MPRLRRRASAPARLPGRLPDPAGRRAARAAGRPLPLRPAQRAVLLPDRGQALRQRHGAAPDPGVSAAAGRAARAGPRLRLGHPFRQRARRARRHEMRRAGQSLGLRAGRRLGLHDQGRADRQAARARTGRQPDLGRAGLAHAVPDRDPFALRGRDQDRTPARALYEGVGQDRARRRPGRRAAGLQCRRGGLGLAQRRQEGRAGLRARCVALRADHPGHAERRGDGGRRLRRLGFARALPGAERDRQRRPSGGGGARSAAFR